MTYKDILESQYESNMKEREAKEVSIDKSFCDLYGVNVNSFISFKSKYNEEMKPLSKEEQVNLYLEKTGRTADAEKSIKRICSERGLVNYTNFLHFRSISGFTSTDEKDINKQIDEYMLYRNPIPNDGTLSKMMIDDGIEKYQFYNWVKSVYGGVNGSVLKLYAEYKKIFLACKSNNIDIKLFNLTCGYHYDTTCKMNLDEKIAFYKDIEESKKIVEETGNNYATFLDWIVKLDKKYSKYSRTELALEYAKFKRNTYNKIGESYSEHVSFDAWRGRNKQKIKGLDKETVMAIYKSVELKVKYGTTLNNEDIAYIIKQIIKDIVKNDVRKEESYGLLCREYNVKYNNFYTFKRRNSELMNNLSNAQAVAVYARYLEVTNRCKEKRGL